MKGLKEKANECGGERGRVITAQCLQDRRTIIFWYNSWPDYIQSEIVAAKIMHVCFSN